MSWVRVPSCTLLKESAARCLLFCTPSFLFLYSLGPLFKARLWPIKVAQTSASTLSVWRKVERPPIARRNGLSADRRLMLLLVFRAPSSPWSLSRQGSYRREYSTVEVFYREVKPFFSRAHTFFIVMWSLFSHDSKRRNSCNVLELVDNFGFLISFFFDKFIC